jgi:hypothetical protein
LGGIHSTQIPYANPRLIPELLGVRLDHLPSSLPSDILSISVSSLSAGLELQDSVNPILITSLDLRELPSVPPDGFAKCRFYLEALVAAFDNPTGVEPWMPRCQSWSSLSDA